MSVRGLTFGRAAETRLPHQRARPQCHCACERPGQTAGKTQSKGAKALLQKAEQQSCSGQGEPMLQH
eukprot:1144703-Pelagomonas_calceolata.AAC.12